MLRRVLEEGAGVVICGYSTRGRRPLNWKYHCRPCPKDIRDRCIQMSNESPSVKMMMRRAFEAGTDTQEMWRRLHMDCLRERLDEQAAAPRASLLGRRLKASTEDAEAASEVVETAKPPVPPSAPAMPAAPREPVSRPVPAQAEVRRERAEKPAPLRYCLAMQNGRHRIGLPTNGEIVLGRFDSATNVTPDVDLSYDDRENFAISRRHSRIIAHDGSHEIEDMGSTNGTRVNSVKLGIGQRVTLRPGDRVGLGYCEFIYVPIPQMKTSLRDPSPGAYLWLTYTGQQFPLPAWGEVVVGRSDVSIGLTPDIDLSAAGDAALVVARRHAKIVARSGRHYVEDLGSANGTRTNGTAIGLKELRMLDLGDHIWLGGCVLAYDMHIDLKV
jgi:pSer/pThr/pTyr-binding forkhead associated (FHA) protein